MIDTIIDDMLLACEVVWAAAGRPHAVFEIDPRRLAELVGRVSTIRASSRS